MCVCVYVCTNLRFLAPYAAPEYFKKAATQFNVHASTYLDRSCDLALSVLTESMHTESKRLPACNCLLVVAVDRSAGRRAKSADCPFR